MLFFREGHGAEKFLFGSRWRCWAFGRSGGRRLGRFSLRFRRTTLLRTTVIAARFIPTLIVAARATLIVLLLRWLRWTLWLDATKGSAQLFQFAFVSELLTVGHFYEL
jgi:hypothetical protein